MSNHKPATALPWTVALKRGAVVSIATAMPRDVLHYGVDADLLYVSHSANAYPKLVKTLRELADRTERDSHSLQFASERHAARELLRELGEAS